MKKGMALIKKHLKKFIIRRRFRQAIMKIVLKVRKGVRKLQKAIKWR